MVPVPAPKKAWVFDGSVQQYPSVLSNGSAHAGKSCVSCHGGDNSKNTRAAAHVGMKAIPGGTDCGGCHSGIVASSAAGLHTTMAGYPAIMSARGFDPTDPAAKVRFDSQCLKCHVANSEGQTACGHCHVSVPSQAGGGLVSGHAFNATPSEVNNCTACHGSRVKDEYYGQNNELLKRNKAAFDAASPWKDPAFALQPDVHKTAGKDCNYCHSADEMHGVGHPTADDRYAVTSTPKCTDCHGAGKADAAAFAAVNLHSSDHLAKIDCYVCHAQPYKNCFDCHTDVTADGVGFFKINGGDPTLEARKAASATPSSVAPDSLMSFRVGVNPKWDGPTDTEDKQFAVLRHVPVDKDVFAYTGVNLIEGLIPDMTAAPTWKYATPHTIQRKTAITASCANCHNPTYFAEFWLTDPIEAGQGWIPSEYQADETTANAGVTVPSPPYPF